MDLLHHHRHDEQGFTLIELLVVILIIGILAAIALPAFLGQRAKAQDANAKSDARNLASQVEACWHADGTGYQGCDVSLTSVETGLDLGAGAGQVQLSTVTANGYEISATSKATQGGSHVYKIVHNIGGLFVRTCTPTGKGACRSDGTW